MAVWSCSFYARDTAGILGSPNLIKAMKQTCRAGVSWSFCLSMEAAGEGKYAGL